MTSRRHSILLPLSAATDTGVLRRRDSKRHSKNAGNESAIERNKRLLQYYNDIRNLEEGKEISIRQIYLRRISLELLKHRKDLYPFPVL